MCEVEWASVALHTCPISVHELGLVCLSLFVLPVSIACLLVSHLRPCSAASFRRLGEAAKSSFQVVAEYEGFTADFSELRVGSGQGIVSSSQGNQCTSSRGRTRPCGWAQAP